MLWDIFCKVIDNHGDIGVCWRLSAELACRGESVRLWVDDPSALQWMAPRGQAGVHALPWTGRQAPDTIGEVVVEAFGCRLGATVEAAIARRIAGGQAPAWINLEYLSAEAFVERNHGLPSPVLSGPAAGATKHFFYPGFTPATGGLIREQALEQDQAALLRDPWLARLGIAQDARPLVSLFCYEPAGLPALLGQLALADPPLQLLVTAGRARAAVESLKDKVPGYQRLQLHWLPLLSQQDYDRLLWTCELNFVRGEDSLVRALWAGRPLVWQPYPQQDDVHLAKLEALLVWLQAPASLRNFHLAWSGARVAEPQPLGEQMTEWAECLVHARSRLLAQPDLVTQLMRFAARLQQEGSNSG